ncbi:hypothetical protein ABG067_004606 [Albugo candida]
MEYLEASHDSKSSFCDLIWSEINLQVYRFFVHRYDQNKLSAATQSDDLSQSVFELLISQCQGYLQAAEKRKGYGPTSFVHTPVELDADVVTVESITNIIEPHETIGEALLLHLLTQCTHQRVQRQRNAIDERMRILNTLETILRDLEAKELWTRTCVRKVIGEEDSLVGLQKLLYEEFVQYEASCSTVENVHFEQAHVVDLHAKANEICELHQKIVRMERRQKQLNEKSPASSQEDDRGELRGPSLITWHQDGTNKKQLNEKFDPAESDDGANSKKVDAQVHSLQSKLESKCQEITLINQEKDKAIEYLRKKSNEQEALLRSLNLQLMASNSYDLSRQYGTISNLQANVEGLENELDRVRGEKDQLSAKLAGKTEIMASIRAENVQLASESHEIRKKMKHAEERQKQKLQERKKLQNRINSTSNAIKEERNRSHTLEKRIYELETGLARATEISDLNQDQVSMLRKKMDEAVLQTNEERMIRFAAEQNALIIATKMRALENELTSLTVTNEKLTNICLAKDQAMNDYKQQRALLDLENRLLHQSIDGTQSTDNKAFRNEATTVIDVDRIKTNASDLKPSVPKVSECLPHQTNVVLLDTSIFIESLEITSNRLIADCCRVLDQYSSRLRSLQLSMSKHTLQRRHQDHIIAQNSKSPIANFGIKTDVKQYGMQESFEMTRSSASHPMHRGLNIDRGCISVKKKIHYIVPKYQTGRLQGSKMRKPTPVASALFGPTSTRSCLRCCILKQPRDTCQDNPKANLAIMRWNYMTMIILLQLQKVQRRVHFCDIVRTINKKHRIVDKAEQLYRSRECVQSLNRVIGLLNQFGLQQQNEGASGATGDAKQLKLCCVEITRGLEYHMGVWNKTKSLVHIAQKEARQLRELHLINERLITQMEKRDARKQAELTHAFSLLCATIQELQENPKPSNSDRDRYKHAIQCFGHILHGEFVPARTTCYTHASIKRMMLKIQKEQARILQTTHRQFADDNIKLLQDAVRVLKQGKRINEH